MKPPLPKGLSLAQLQRMTVESNELADRLSAVLDGHDLDVASAALASQVAAWVLTFETHEQRLNQMARFVDLVRTLAAKYEHDPAFSAARRGGVS